MESGQALTACTPLVFFFVHSMSLQRPFRVIYPRITSISIYSTNSIKRKNIEYNHIKSTLSLLPLSFGKVLRARQRQLANLQRSVLNPHF